MGRKHPIIAIYMLMNTVNGKIYIGETTNYADRMSYYRNTASREAKHNKRPIAQAILQYGADAFIMTTLLTDKQDPELKDFDYRIQKEAEYIKMYKATNPSYGYNVEDKALHRYCGGRKKGTEVSAATRILKSDMIFVYDKDDESVVTYFGKKDFADDIGKDRSIIARCAKNGKSTSHYYVFEAEYDIRLENARNIIYSKIHAKSTNGKAEKSLKNYIEALHAVNDYCEYWGYQTIDIDAVVEDCK